MAIPVISSTSASRDPTGRGRTTRPVALAARAQAGTGEQVGERRRHRRVPSAGLTVTIDDHDYPVRDLSVGGFRIGPYAGPLKPGGQFQLRFRVQVNGKPSEFRGRGKVLRRQGEDLVAVYMADNPRFYQGLTRFIAHESALRLSYHGHGRAPLVADPAFVETSA